MSVSPFCPATYVVNYHHVGQNDKCVYTTTGMSWIDVFNKLIAGENNKFIFIDSIHTQSEIKAI